MSLNLSEVWIDKKSKRQLLEYHTEKTNSSRRCLIFICTWLLPTGSRNVFPKKTQSRIQLGDFYCEQYTTSAVAIATCAFILVLVLFALFHDVVLMRTFIVVAAISVSIAFPSSWLHLTFVLIFIVLFTFTGATTSARFSKMFIFYMQTFYSIFPPQVENAIIEDVYVIFRFTGLKFTTIPCIFPKSLIYSVNREINNFACSVCASLIVLFITVCFVLFKNLIESCKRPEQNVTPLKHQLAFALVFSAYFSFFNVSTFALKAFRNQLGTGSEIQIAIAGCIFFVVLSIGSLVFLPHRHRNRLDSEEVMSWLGFLYKSYREENALSRRRNWQYYEIYFMLFRLLLAVFLILVEKDWRFIAMALVLVAMVLFYYKVTPFTDLWANFVAIVPIVSLVIINVIIYVYLKSRPSSFSSIADDLILIVNLVTIAFFMKLIVPRGWRQCCAWCKACHTCSGRQENNRDAFENLIPTGDRLVVNDDIEECIGTEVNVNSDERQWSSPSEEVQCKEVEPIAN